MNTIDEQLKRPEQRSQEILTKAAMELLQSLRDKELSPDDPNAIKQLSDAMRSSLDGYEICRELEQRHYWQPDAHMVDTFDGAFSAVHAAHRKAVVEWVSSTGIRPQRTLGDEVNVTYQGDEYAGEIVRVQAETAEYTVMIPALGHVKEGLGTLGCNFKFEDIHELAEPSEDFSLRSPAPCG